ncbi:MAG: hypothetical protein F7B60_02875, partial [Desulfurococcales archaeon]|nr:hypothetical protein [Desulfurococcales archaeon]
EKNRLVREILIRKSRGSPLTIARVPFAITEKGLRVWAPPSLETIPPLEESKVYHFPCEALEKYIGPLYGGMTIYLSYPVDARPYQAMPILMGLSVYNKAKTLIITYSNSPEQIKELLAESFIRRGYLSKDSLEVLMKKISELFVIRGFNPSAYSIEELFAQEMKLMADINPEVTIFHGINVLGKISEEYLDLLRNQILFLKSKGSLTFRLGSFSSEENYASNARVSDAVARFKYESLEEPAERRKSLSLYIWVAGLDPIILNYNTIAVCEEEMTLKLKELIQRGGN